MDVRMPIGKARGRTAQAGAQQLSNRVARREWSRWYATRLNATDTLTVLLVVGIAQWLCPGKQATFSIAVAMLWLTALWLAGARSQRVIGAGADEYRRVIIASVQTAGAIAIVAQLARVDVARDFVAVALPTGLVGLVVSRRLWRSYIARQRSKGQFQTALMAIGDGDEISLLVTELTRNSRDGYRVVGIGIPGYGPGRGESVTINGCSIPIVGDEQCALSAVEQLGADTVAITGSESFGMPGIRRLAWQLDALDVALVVSPGALDVAEAQLRVRPVAGLPLVQVEKPRYLGAPQVKKRVFDVCFAMAALIFTAPVLLAVALAIKITSRGPVFDKSERIGLDGEPFSMLTFRSVVVEADQPVDALLADNDSVSDVLFKMLDEPKLTPVGRLIRRFSIDHLPQFINVLRRDMSVVGPRPPLRREVAKLDGEVRRRLLVKPGITGLWQVSGGADLSWDQWVRLDLSYVENWSAVGDLAIVVKTVRALRRRGGAR